jgi:transcriptional regulatory protein LEU3
MLLAAKLHLDGFAFFLSPGSPAREEGLTNLHNAACSFIRKIMDIETATGTLLEHCTNIIVQSFFSATFALLKLLHSSFTKSINTEHGKALFNAAILAIRRMSLRNDDVCARMAIRIPLLAKDMSPGGLWSSAQYDPLELKIRARMCANHSYDCMWHWLTARRQEARVRDAAANLAPVQEAVPDIQAQVDLSQTSLPDLIGDGFDLFNSMDWLLNDFTCGAYDFSAGTL